MTYKKIFVISFVCILVLGFNLLFFNHSADAFSNQVIQKGATGEDVIELQSRLQYNGFYNGDIDGVFGWGTYWALRNFQKDFGMKTDGLAGTQTKEKLTSATKYDKNYVHKQLKQGNDFTYYGGSNQSKNTKDETTKKQKEAEPTSANVPEGYSQNDIQLIANAVNGEARGEKYIGQVAVAAVILNRVDSSKFPDTVSNVIFEPGAFTAVSDGQIWLTPNETSKKAAMDAANGWDPSGHALYYFNPKTATSDWIWSRKQIKQIGKHIFAK